MSRLKKTAATSLSIIEIVLLENPGEFESLIGVSFVIVRFEIIVDEHDVNISGEYHEKRQAHENVHCDAFGHVQIKVLNAKLKKDICT